MNVSDILALARAGFSAKQIAAMQQIAQPAPADPASAAQQIAQIAQPAPADPASAAQQIAQTAPAPVPAHEPTPAPAPAAPVPAAPAPAAPDPTAAKLDTLISLMQQQQLAQPQPQPMTADQILADIIAPQPAEPAKAK